MRIWIVKTVGLLALMGLLTSSARADNNCNETGPHTNAWQFLRQGTVVSSGALSYTNLTVGPGVTFAPPVLITNLGITNGLEDRWIWWDCTNDYSLDHWQTNAVVFTNALFFVPAMANILWTPGVYTYTGIVVATGSPCAPITNTLGTVTVNVGTNNADVLLDVDFGGGTPGKTGYAAIGDSAGDRWNYFQAGGGVVSGALPSLVTADGYVSPVGLLVSNLPNSGTNGSSDPMYNDYLAVSGGATATVTLTNLPSGTWSVYLYSDDGNFDLSVRDINNNVIVDYGTQTCHDLPLSSPLAWQQGVQYVVFTNVAVGGSQRLVLTVAPGQSGVAMISGLQIASTSHALNLQSLLPPGIVAWWRAESNYLDSVGTNNGLSENGMGFTPGEVGNAFSFNGVHSFVLVNATPALNVGLSNGMTIEGWIKPSSLGSAQLLCEYERALATGNGSDVGVQLGINNIPNGQGEVAGALAANLVDTTHAAHVLGSAGNLLAAGVWNHVAMTYNKTLGVGALYVNGVQVMQTNLGSFIPQTSFTNLLLGARTTFNSVASPSNPFSGGMDEMSFYNRALATNEIAAIYNAGSLGKYGLPLTQDSDYDGVSDLQELADRTNPDDPNSVLPIRLGYWRFDNTNTWIGDAGQLPLLATNLVGAPSWDTNAVLIDSGNPAILTYRDVETNGNANINLRCGTVQFWFKPDWGSTNAGGVGPQNEGRLLEMGVEGSPNGWWGLVVGSGGTNLYFGTQTNAVSTLTTNLVAGISWCSNFWHQVVLTYNPTNTTLYIDGQAVVTNGAGVAYYPGPGARANGFTLGNSASGQDPARGSFEDLTTYNYPLSAAAVTSGYQAQSLLPESATLQLYAPGKIAGGRFHSLVVECDGTVRSWGQNDHGQLGCGAITSYIGPFEVTNVLVSGTYSVGYLNGIKAVAAGNFHSLALTTGGTVMAWGANDSGQLGTTYGSSSPYYWPRPAQVIGSYNGAQRTPYALSNVVAVAGGWNHSLALKGDGTVWGWGDNTYGQIGSGTSGGATPVQIAGLPAIVAIAGGPQCYHHLALASDGSVWEWGSGASPYRVSGLSGTVVAVACDDELSGLNHDLALTSDGSVWAWGYVAAGWTPIPAPLRVALPAGVVAIAGGGYGHFLVLEADGTVWSWGYNNYGQLGNGTPAGGWGSSVPARVLNLTQVAGIAVGGYHSLAIQQNSALWGWGAAYYDVGQGGPSFTIPTGMFGLTPCPAPTVSTPASVTACAGSTITFSVLAGGSQLHYQWMKQVAGSHAVALANGGNVSGAASSALQLSNLSTSDVASYYVVVSDWGGTVTSGTATLTLNPANIINPPPQPETAAPGYNVEFGGFVSGKKLPAGNSPPPYGYGVPDPISYQWQFNGVNIPGAVAPTLLLTNVQASQAGTYTLAINGPCDSASASSILSMASSPTPVAPMLSAGWDNVSLRCDGTVWSMGAGTAPVQVNGLAEITAVASGWDHGMALKSDGTIRAWGSQNLQGQLGTGDTAYFNRIEVVSGLSGITAIAAGEFSGCALKSDGTVWMWGGQQYEDQVTVPITLVSGLPAITAIFGHSSDDYYYGLTANGSVWVWGGIGVYSTPSQIAGLTGVTAIGWGGGGGYNSYVIALKSDGTVWALGANYYGQLGVGNPMTGIYDTTTPVQIPGLSGITAISGGGFFFSLALKYDGTVWAWGRNYEGELGDGKAETIAYTPVQVSGLSDITAIAAGNEHSLALKADGSIWIWGDSVNNVPVAIPNANACDNGFQITTPPASQTACAGTTVKFNVTASGWPLTYQWQKNGVNLVDGGEVSGSATPTLTLTGIAVADAAQYTVVVSDGGHVVSSSATLTVPTICNLPVITSLLPQSQTIADGSIVTFTVVASGNAPLTYQWQKNGIALIDGVNVSGSATAQLTLLGVVDNGGNNDFYTVTVSNGYGSSSATATLKVTGTCGTTITSPPQSQVVAAGSTVNFNVAATGTSLSYQWYKNGLPISGATLASLQLVNVSATDAAFYSVYVCNGSSCCVLSQPASLEVGAFKVRITEPKSNALLP